MAEFTATKFDLKKLETSLRRSIVWCEKYFEILNRLRHYPLHVDHECDGQTDWQAIQNGL